MILRNKKKEEKIKKNEMHMTGTMANPMNGALRLRQEKAFVKKFFLFRIRSSQPSLIPFARVEGEEIVSLKKNQSTNWT